MRKKDTSRFLGLCDSRRPPLMPKIESCCLCAHHWSSCAQPHCCIPSPRAKDPIPQLTTILLEGTLRGRERVTRRAGSVRSGPVQAPVEGILEGFLVGNCWPGTVKDERNHIRPRDRDGVTGMSGSSPAKLRASCLYAVSAGWYVIYLPGLLTSPPHPISPAPDTHPAHIPHPIWEHCIALSNKRRPHPFVCHTTNGKQELFASCNGITACAGPRLTVHHLTHHPLPLFPTHPRAGPVEPHLPISAWDLCDHQPSLPPPPVARWSRPLLTACLPACPVSASASASVSASVSVSGLTVRGARKGERRGEFNSLQPAGERQDGGSRSRQCTHARPIYAGSRDEERN